MREISALNGTVRIHGQIDGVDHPIAPTLVFANSLGTTLALWRKVLPLLPDGLRIIRYDLRGHGQSDVPDAPYTMGQLISDAAAICDAANVTDAMFVGLSVGGMIGQGLAVKRPDLIRALVLSNTAAKIGNPKLWDDRVAAVQAHGMAALADTIMPRWFGRDFVNTPEMMPWRDMVSAVNPQGYAGVCAAIAGTDFYTPTSGLRIPTLGIAGGQDGATPADLVRETVDLVPGSQFKVMPRCGHLPCAEDPIGYAEILSEFMANTGHLTGLAN
ncbi:MAG: 3-oxoadipate enol-lactonase [Yoonia sp.]|nr:3-oxoadipate enol-lactonase [Yoonia sp.]